MPRKATEAAATKKPAAKESALDAPHDRRGGSRSCSTGGTSQSVRTTSTSRRWRRGRELAARGAGARRRRSRADRTNVSAGRSARPPPQLLLAISQARGDFLRASVLSPLPEERARPSSRAHDRHGCSVSVSASRSSIAIASLSNGLDQRAEEDARPARRDRHRPDRHLQPATSRTPAAGSAAAGSAAAAGGGGANRDLIQANLSVSPTCRSSASPARTSCTTSSCRARSSPSSRARRSRSRRSHGVAQVTHGPDAARRAPGGRRAEDRRDAEDAGEDLHDHAERPRPSAADFAQMQACFAKAGGQASARAAATAAAAVASAAVAAAASAAAAAASTGRVLQKCLPGVAAAVPHALHLAEPDAASRC